MNAMVWLVAHLIALTGFVILGWTADEFAATFAPIALHSGRLMRHRS